MIDKSKIYEEQLRLYTKAFDTHKGTAQATLQVHEDLQFLRFEEITKQCEFLEGASILDYGCGQGDFLKYLRIKGFDVKYTGVDINQSYINYAKDVFHQRDGKFLLLESLDQDITSVFDHVVISGMFHFKGSCHASSWSIHIKELTKNLFRNANKSLAFNCLTYPVDFQDKNLFYWDPGDACSFVKENLTRFFSISHSYPLFEWTLSAFNKRYVQNKYKVSSAMNKYF